MSLSYLQNWKIFQEITLSIEKHFISRKVIKNTLFEVINSIQMQSHIKIVTTNFVWNLFSNLIRGYGDILRLVT